MQAFFHSTKQTNTVNCSYQISQLEKALAEYNSLGIDTSKDLDRLSDISATIDDFVNSKQDHESKMLGLEDKVSELENELTKQAKQSISLDDAESSSDHELFDALLRIWNDRQLLNGAGVAERISKFKAYVLDKTLQP
jgi:predicted  nucleic acid-binding Zn-ribbon protein